MDDDRFRATLGLAATGYWMMVGVIRHLVEEGKIPPDIAGDIVSNAAHKGLPDAGSSGELYDEARNMVLDFAGAISGFPVIDGANDQRRPQHDS